MVIGADSTLACNGRLFDKPPTLAAARQQLLALRGQTHELCLLGRGGARRRAPLALQRDARGSPCGRSPSPSSTPIWRAPASTVRPRSAPISSKGLGAHLFSRVDGDYFTILGLPLLPLLSFLQSHGIGLEPKT